MKKRLGELELGGVLFDIFEGTEEDIHHLADCYGFCDNENQEIWLQAGMKPTQFRQVLLHEIQHAIFEHSGILNFMADTLRVTRGSEKLRSFEEQFIRINTPHLIRAMASLKKLRAGK